MPNCFQFGIFFVKSSMVTRTYVNCLLTIALSNSGIFDRFWPNFPRFFSLFSVTLLTIQEVVFNEINDLRGGGLQAEIGWRSRLRIENALIWCVLPPWPHVVDAPGRAICARFPPSISSTHRRKCSKGKSPERPRFWF